MRTISEVVSVIVILAVGACGGASKPAGGGAKASNGSGIALRSAAGTALTDPDHIRLVGVAKTGELLDYGEMTREIALDRGRMTTLPPGKPSTAGEIALTTSTAAFVLIVDVDRPAAEIHKAVASLDKVCWGFGVAVGDKLGVALPAPCPAGPANRPEDDTFDLTLLVGRDKVRIAISRFNEQETIARGADIQAKLAEYKRSDLFKGDPCPAQRPEEPRTDEDEESGGTGTAMAFSMPTWGRCDLMMAFDSSAKVGDVVDFFRHAMAAGFTEPHWVAESDLPKIGPKPPPPEPPPDTPEYRKADKAVEKAQKKRDDAMAELNATIKDTSKSAADIKAATARLKKADEELKTAKKQRRDARKKK